MLVILPAHSPSTCEGPLSMSPTRNCVISHWIQCNSPGFTHPWWDDFHLFFDLLRGLFLWANLIKLCDQSTWHEKLNRHRHAWVMLLAPFHLVSHQAFDIKSPCPGLVSKAAVCMVHPCRVSPQMQTSIERIQMRLVCAVTYRHLFANIHLDMFGCTVQHLLIILDIETHIFFFSCLLFIFCFLRCPLNRSPWVDDIAHLWSHPFVLKMLKVQNLHPPKWRVKRLGVSELDAGVKLFVINIGGRK